MKPETENKLIAGLPIYVRARNGKTGSQVWTIERFLLGNKTNEQTGNRKMIAEQSRQASFGDNAHVFYTHGKSLSVADLYILQKNGFRAFRQQNDGTIKEMTLPSQDQPGGHGWKNYNGLETWEELMSHPKHIEL